MDQTTLITAAVCLVIGVVVGALLSRLLSPQGAQSRELKRKLLEKEEELKLYRRDVSEHFIKTADQLRELTRGHRELSEQLAVGAMRLTAPEISRDVHDTVFEGLSTDNRFSILSSVPPEPPKDYAPSVPGGVLSESYGLTELRNNGATAGLFESKPAATAANDQDDDPTLKIS